MQPKPGYKTTELYVTLITTLIAVLVATGTLSPEEGEDLKGAINSAIQAALALAGALTPIAYVISRTYVKTRHAASE